MKTYLRSLWLAGQQFTEHQALRLGAALAFYSIFSIGPLVIIVLSISGGVFGEEAVRGQLERQLDGLMGERAAGTVEDLVASAKKEPDDSLMGLIGGVVLVFGASGVFNQLKDALNTVWGVRRISGGAVWGFLKDRFLSFSMVLGIGFLLLVSMILTTALYSFTDLLGRVLALPAEVWRSVSFLISFAVVTLLFAMIFKVLPDAKISWRDVWVGAATTSLLFSVGKSGVALYLSREATGSAYGAAGALVVLLMWVYFASVIVLFGAEFTRVWARARGRTILPRKNYERIPLLN
ncbi:MAG: YihY/virulence factor BrkB family protein [Verrucomicrobiaceae bacterium]